MQFVKGPDFPTGGSILGRAGIIDAYRTGRGSVRMRATAEIEEVKGGVQIVVTELPYQTSATAIAARIGELANDQHRRGHPLDRQLLVGRRHSARHRPEARRERQRRAEQPLQAHADADQLRDQHGRARRQRAPHAQPRVDADRVRRAPGRGHHPPVRVPAAQGPRPRAHRRGPAARARHDRRHHRSHPRVRRSWRGARRA